jgi:type VI secretion system secreted protein Hcp
MAAVDYFLKIDGIQGESQDDKHKNEIQLESWSFGANQSGSFASGGGGGAGKVQMQDLHFVKRARQVSTYLKLCWCAGRLARISKSI